MVVAHTPDDVGHNKKLVKRVDTVKPPYKGHAQESVINQGNDPQM